MNGGSADIVPPTDEPLLSCSAATGSPATAICTHCGAAFSSPFLAVRTDGRAVCHPCARRAQIPCLDVPAGTDTRDPVLALGWPKALLHIAMHPHRTFAAIHNGPLREAVVFGLVATLIGYAATTGWNLTLHGPEFLEFYRQAAAERSLELTTDASVQKLLWLALPFAATLRFVLGLGLLHLGVRIVVGSAQSSFRDEARVFALASGTLVIAVVPVLGPFIALVSWISACTAYLQVVHGLGTARSLMAVLPSFLVITAMGPSSFVPS